MSTQFGLDHVHSGRYDKTLYAPTPFLLSTSCKLFGAFKQFCQYTPEPSSNIEDEPHLHFADPSHNVDNGSPQEMLCGSNTTERRDGIRCLPSFLSFGR